MPRRKGTKPSKKQEDTLRLNIYEGEKAYQRNRPLCVLEATVADSISSVKAQIQDIEGIAPEQQRIFSASRTRLEDDYKLVAQDMRFGICVQFPMRIFVSLLSGEALAVDVMRSDSIEEVEEKVWDLLSRPVPKLTQRQFDRMLHDTEMQNVVTSPFAKLLFGTMVLSITRTLASYGIPNGAALTCIFTDDFDVDQAA